MKPATLSVCMTIHERPEDVLYRVFESIRNQPFDEVVIALDRSPKSVSRWLSDNGWWPDPFLTNKVRTVELAGPPGWRGPAKAWNAALDRVTSEITLMLSSETIQGPDNVRIARETLGKRPCVLFGRAEDSSGTPQVVGFPPGLLCSAEYPRPLGFVWAVPTWALRAIGGYDEEFMKGLCYDDDDISYRLWKLGLPFVFHDGMGGIHQFHERPGLTSNDGLHKTALNRDYIRQKFAKDNLPEPRENPLNALHQAGRIMEHQLVKAGGEFPHTQAVTIWEQMPSVKARARFTM